MEKNFLNELFVEVKREVEDFIKDKGLEDAFNELISADEVTAKIRKHHSSLQLRTHELLSDLPAELAETFAPLAEECESYTLEKLTDHLKWILKIDLYDSVQMISAMLSTPIDDEDDYFEDDLDEELEALLMESVRECLDELINPENVEKVLNYLENQYVDMVLNRIIAITTFMCLPDDVIDMIEKHLDSNDGVAIGFIIPKDSDDDKPDNK